MKTALAIRHVQFEDLGSFAMALRDHGYAVSYLDAGVDPLAVDATQAADLLIVLGGPIGAYEDDLYPFLRDELALISRRLAERRPLVGVCLGAQLIARALGARVYPAAAKEIGWSTVELTEEGLRSPLATLQDVAVLHWHGDTFDLPAGATRLASTALCANQAFSVSGHVLGFQFHPETAAGEFERWLIGHACEIAAAPGVSVSDLRRQARLYAGRGATQGKTCLSQWLDALIA